LRQGKLKKKTNEYPSRGGLGEPSSRQKKGFPDAPKLSKLPGGGPTERISRGGTAPFAKGEERTRRGIIREEKDVVLEKGRW